MGQGDLMAVFTAISMWATSSLAFMGAGGISFLGMSPALTASLFRAGSAIGWSLASQALQRQNVPRQQVQANINQTDSPRVRGYGRVLLGGIRAFWETDDGKLFQIIVLHHGQVDGLISFWVDGKRVTVDAEGAVTSDPFDTGGTPDLTLLFRDGSGEGGDYPMIRDQFPDLWTAAHKLMGQATMGARMDHPGAERFAKVFPKGPQTVLQAEVRASRVRNMAGALIYSENAGLAVRDYFTHPDGWRIPLASVDDASFAAFVARCGEGVPLKAGGTEPRYRICGTYSLDDAPKDVTARMLAACDGQVYQTPEGKVGILGGAWSAPDVTITADDILELSVEDGFDPFTDFNILKGSFTSPAHEYQPTEVPELRDAAALSAQGERVEQIEIDLCPSGSQMQRLMKIHWAKKRRDMTGTLTTNLVGLKARFPKGDGIHTIRVQAPEFGLDGVFEVTSHSFSVPDGTCRIGIASISNPYPWNAATEEREITPPSGILPQPGSQVPPPAGVSMTQVPVRVSGDTYGGKLRLTVNPVARNDVHLEAQVAEGDVAPDAGSPVVWVAMGGDRFSAETGILEDRKIYTVRYRWRGQRTWQKAGSVTIVANPNVPAAPAGFARVGSTGASFKWVNPTTNFWLTRLFRNTTNSFSGASVIHTTYGTAGQEMTRTDGSAVAGTTYYYWVVALNGSLVASPPAGPVTITP